MKTRPPDPPDFDGETYRRLLDHERLARQFDRWCDLMRDGVWRSLRSQSRRLGEPEASCSARLRDARKEKFGGLVWIVQHRRRPSDSGTWQYRLLPRVRLGHCEECKQLTNVTAHHVGRRHRHTPSDYRWLCAECWKED
jgi:hypothetical protein